MSTTILVNKMKDYAKTIGKEYDIAAYAIDSASTVAQDADCVLLGPQVSFRKKDVEQYLTCPLEAIDMRTYGMMDGKLALQQAMKLMNEGV